MKTALATLFVVIFVSLACNAQTNKGAIMIGGSGSVSTEWGFNASFSPTIGYFFIDNLAVGCGLPVTYSSRESYRSAGGGVSPFLRYYVGQTAATRVFAEATGSYIVTQEKGPFNYPDLSIQTSFRQRNSFGGGIGLAHFLTEQIGLEAKLLYLSRINNYSNNFFTSDPFRRNSFSLELGVQVYLPGSSTK